MGILLYLASWKLSRVAGGWWLEKPILMKTQSSVCTWTCTLDFDLGFVKIVKLNDEALSAALKYFYKKSSEEFIEICGKKLANKLGILEDGILYSKSRLLEEQ